MKEPTANGNNGRDNRGRFTEGNPGGPGNPQAKRVGELRFALLGAVTEDDVREVIASVVQKAKDGDMVAARVLFDRVLGPAVAADILERITALEELVGRRD